MYHTAEMKKARSFILPCFIAMLLANPNPAQASAPTLPPELADSSVELHAHLFMKEGLSWFFSGEFFGPLTATNWKNRFSSQTNPETVHRSRIGVLVVALYAHPVFTRSLKNSIRRQIALAERFVKEHPQWIIARDPAEARAALAQGKRVLVLSLEGAAGVLETNDDLREFIDQRGIRIVTLLHLTDDHYGGAALMRGVFALASPLAWFRQLFHDHRVEGVKVNDLGLTTEGRTLARKLIERQVWIDLAHSPDRAQEELIPMIREAGHPLLYTHTTLRKYLGAERGLAAWQLEQVARSRGVIGLMPSEDMLHGTPGESIHALAVQYEESAARIGNQAVAMGSDYNGGVCHLKPIPNAVTGTSLDHEGLWNISQVGELWEALRKVNAPVPASLGVTVEHFLEAWERVARK